MPEALKSALVPQETSGEAATLRTLNAFAVDVMAIRSAEDLFWYVAQNVVGRLQFVDCVIYRAEGRELMQAAALGEKNPYGRTILNPLRIPFGQGITGQVADTREPIIIDDLLKDRNYIPDTQPARSEICVPLISQGQVVGVIDSEHPDVGAFGQAELDVLTTVAAMTSAKLDLLAEAERSSRRYCDLVEAHAQLTRETDNRKALEAELFEARKLESVGRLTGGFAHEFNNLLTVIAGNLDLLEPHIPGAEPLLYAADARQAAQRGATLIQNMLTFAQRTRLQPRLTDLNALVRQVCQRDGLNAADDIDLGLVDEAWPVVIDPVVAEIALLNLIENARDAMPSGGRVEITTKNIHHDPLTDQALAAEIGPGRYTRLSVTDHGSGIDADALPRIFDPFFTTKPTGQGSGLGLSMVMGFMKQSGGWVRARPNVTSGAVIDLYFPMEAGPTRSKPARQPA